MQRKVTGVMAAILALAGIGGFLIPSEYALFSGAIWYNVFHLVFSIVAVVCYLVGEQTSKWFNLIFGMIDLAQLILSLFNLFPSALFAYTIFDDLAHFIVGIGLVVVALAGRSKELKT